MAQDRWHDMLDCDGSSAGARAELLCQQHRLSVSDARERVMREFPAVFRWVLDWDAECITPEGSHSASSRVNWLIANKQMPLPLAQARVLSEFPSEVLWNDHLLCDAHTAASRAAWLQSTQHLDVKLARARVRAEFRALFLATTVPQGPHNTVPQGPHSAGSHHDSHAIGFNVSLGLARKPLEPLVAARRLVSVFPGAKRAKLFNYDAALIDALQTAGITHIVVSVPNVELEHMASRSRASAVASQTAAWVQRGLQVTIAVGNEPLAKWYSRRFAALVCPALEGLHHALAAQHVRARLTVPFDFGIMGVSYPPSAASFAKDCVDVVRAVAELLARDNSPFFINVYPFFAHRDNAENIPLAFALGEQPHTCEGHRFPSLLEMQLAAVRSALLKLSPRFDAATLPIDVGETGARCSNHSRCT